MTEVKKNLTFSCMRSSCRFWLLTSVLMSIAIFRRFPTIVDTCWIFSSISSSRASLVILQHRFTSWRKTPIENENIATFVKDTAILFRCYNQTFINEIVPSGISIWNNYLSIFINNLPKVFPESCLQEVIRNVCSKHTIKSAKSILQGSII